MKIVKKDAISIAIIRGSFIQATTCYPIKLTGKGIKGGRSHLTNMKVYRGGGIDAHKSWIDLIYKVNNLLISLLLQYYFVPAYSLHNHENKCVPL